LTQDQGKTWAQTEFGEAKLGDLRLSKRLTLIAETLINHPTSSIPQACGSWNITKATYVIYLAKVMVWSEGLAE
jgi:hypothetical protein